MIGEPLPPIPRKPLTKAQRHELWTRQGGLCGRRGCWQAIPERGPGVIDEHIIPLEFRHPEANAMRNRALYCSACAAKKTASDQGDIAKAKRLAGETGGNRHRRRIRSRGFDKPAVKPRWPKRKFWRRP